MDDEQHQHQSEESREAAALLKLQEAFHQFVHECRNCRREIEAHWQFCGFCRKARFLGQNPKIEYQEFNELQTLKRSKKQLCDRTLMLPRGTTTHENRIYKTTV
jgi:hypothetical protein